MRSVLAVLAAPIIYGAVCLPTNWLIVNIFPAHFDERWITGDTGLLFLLVSLTVVFSGASGYVGARIAPGNVMAHAAAIGALLLAIGIAAESQYWTALPLWYHLAFFGLILLGTPLGAWMWLTTSRGPASR
jgi:hypothetical protein